MNLDRVDAGSDVPNNFNVVIEISMNGDPIKYELDKATGALFVDRFMSTAMHYPVDVLVITPFALQPGVVVRCRPVGVLKMTDEAGGDEKLLAVPIDKVCSIYRSVQTPRDLPEITLNQIAHFFQHYKDLELGKWVKLEGWLGPEEAKKAIIDGISKYDAALATKYDAALTAKAEK
jgi:inorganic pyrophosphatase